MISAIEVFRLTGPSGSPAAMVDRTIYAPDAIPELSLRQVFGRDRLPQALRRVVADKKLLSIKQFAMATIRTPLVIPSYK